MHVLDLFTVVALRSRWTSSQSWIWLPSWKCCVAAAAAAAACYFFVFPHLLYVLFLVWFTVSYVFRVIFWYTLGLVFELSLMYLYSKWKWKFLKATSLAALAQQVFLELFLDVIRSDTVSSCWWCSDTWTEWWFRITIHEQNFCFCEGSSCQTMRNGVF